MDVSYTLGKFTGTIINRLAKLNFFLKLYIAYVIISNVTFYKQDFIDLMAYSSVVFSFIVAALFYYWAFVCFRGSLRWIGKQLNYYQGK